MNALSENPALGLRPKARGADSGLHSFGAARSSTTADPKPNFQAAPAHWPVIWRKHHEDRTEASRTWKIDWYSTAVMFPGWAEYGDQPFFRRGPPTYDPLIAYQPQTWLLREGYKRGGPAI